ncbi:Holliday junction resolvase RuvX [Cytophaga sp. FL35]|uniref:Holliday junction resolvase RuvX n=1 Tax=Cytophaga sp. FL35 TaxID=1904456 RepID=UPI0016535412|nr:Holliday junction resolvase RuvX [Cytophaga sp. FL35]MBC6998818.1 Holliday junction resolvase RuvX [Cytophaga sp. FL35]
MGRLLALDFGQKRTGIAVTDELQIIASGLTTEPTEKVVDFLKDYLARENVERFIIGEPKQMDNSPSQSEVYIQEFILSLKSVFPNIPIERQDERFTSKLAVKSMVAGGLKKKQRKNKALVDQISATIILQDYLNKIK